MSILVVSIVAALAAAASAEMPRSGDDVVVCEAGGGFYEEQPVPNSGSASVLRARVRIVGTHADRKRVPAAGLLFKLGKARHAGVQIFIDPARPDRLTIGLKTPGDVSPRRISTLPIDEEVEIGARLEGDVLTAWAGDKARSVRIKGANAERSLLMCSSGTFRFDF